MVGMSVPFMLPATATMLSGIQEATVVEAPLVHETRAKNAVSNVPLGQVTIAGLPAAPGFSRNGNSSAIDDLNLVGAVVSLQQRVMAPITEKAVAFRNPYAHYFMQVHV